MPACKSCSKGFKLKEQTISDPRTNERIRVPEVRLVGPSGEQIGVVPIATALRLAAEADLDLVEVAPNSRPPVAKIMDFGKFKYEAAQKQKEARRNQANTVLKEVRFRLKIDRHDYETKLKHATGFLSQGDKVKAMILFRGREQSRPEMGVKLLQQFAEDIAEYGSIESAPRVDGRNMVMVISPLRGKAEARAELNARRAEAKANRRAERQARAEAEKAQVKEKPVAAFEFAPASPADEAAAAAPGAGAEAGAAAAKTAKPAAAAKTTSARKPAASKPAAAKSTAAKPAAKTAAKPAAAGSKSTAKPASKTTKASKKSEQSES